MNDLTIVIPAKNEQETICSVLKEIKDKKFNLNNVILVDGRSSDKTIELAKNYKCKIIKQVKTIGYGHAVKIGIENSKTQYTAILDADGSKNPKYLNKLIKNIRNKKYDFIFAERYGLKAKSYDDTFTTYIGNRIFTYLGKILFKLKINDILHTFFICKTEMFKKIKFEYDDFSFCSELPIKVHLLKLKYSTIPSIERKRFGGNVKVKPFKDGYKILISILKLYLKTLRISARFF